MTSRLICRGPSSTVQPGSGPGSSGMWADASVSGTRHIAELSSSAFPHDENTSAPFCNGRPDIRRDTGTLAVAASGIPGTYLFPALLTRFADERPGVVIDARLSTSAGAIELVRAHEVELAVVGGLTLPTELVAEELVEDEIVLVGPPSLRDRRLTPSELEAFTWVSREEGSSTRGAVEAARKHLGLHAPRTLELPAWEAVKLAVSAGAGIAAISRYAIGVEIAAGTLTVLDAPRWRLSRTITVVRAESVPLTPPAEHFLELLRRHFHVLPAA